MSKRFGRNKRRRARELLADREDRIEKLGQALDMSRGLAKHLTTELEFTRNELAEAKEIAGEMSVLFPAKDMPVSGPARGRVGVVIEPNFPSFSDYQMEMATCNRTTVDFQTLSVMLAKVDKRALDEMVHVHVMFDDKCVGYAISKSAQLCRNGVSMERELMRALPKMISLKLFGGARHDR